MINLLFVLMLATTGWADSSTISTRVILKLKSDSDIQSLATVDGLQVLQSIYGSKRHYVAQVNSHALLNLEQNSKIEYVETDQRYSADVIASLFAAPTDPRWNELWGIQKMQIPQTWAKGFTGSRKVVVGIVDTGIDRDHPDLRGNIWSNPGESGSLAQNGKDDDGNGLVDDQYGWDFSTQNAETHDDWGHGTHLAGTIGAVGNNSLGVVGVNWQVSLMPVKWMKDGKGWGSDAISSIRYAVRMGARILNNSWGGIGYSRALEEAVQEAERAGVLFVASAGNNGQNNDDSPRHPSSLKIPNVLSVTATDPNDLLPSFANWGVNSVHVAAPGFDILSTGIERSYRVLSGTSMATSHVSGLAALILSIHPTWTHVELKRAILGGVEKVSNLDGKIQSGGRVRMVQPVFH